MAGANGIVDSDLVPKLCQKLSGEWVGIKLLILDTLHFCSRVNPKRCLEAGILAALKVCRLWRMVVGDVEAVYLQTASASTPIASSAFASKNIYRNFAGKIRPVRW